jgi:hypothetical protein
MRLTTFQTQHFLASLLSHSAVFCAHLSPSLPKVHSRASLTTPSMMIFFLLRKINYYLLPEYDGSRFKAFFASFWVNVQKGASSAGGGRGKGSDGRKGFLTQAYTFTTFINI